MKNKPDILKRFTIDTRTNCWKWHNLNAAGEPRRLWMCEKGRHIPPQRLLWDRFCPDNTLDRNHSLKRTCQSTYCVNPEHHVKVKRAGKRIVVYAPGSELSVLTNEAARSAVLHKALHLAVHTPWSSQI